MCSCVGAWEFSWLGSLGCLLWGVGEGCGEGCRGRRWERDEVGRLGYRLPLLEWSVREKGGLRWVWWVARRGGGGEKELGRWWGGQGMVGVSEGDERERERVGGVSERVRGWG